MIAKNRPKPAVRYVARVTGRSGTPYYVTETDEPNLFGFPDLTISERLATVFASAGEARLAAGACVLAGTHTPEAWMTRR